MWLVRFPVRFTAVWMLIAGTAAAQGYPEKPVTMIAPFPAGGSVDLVARAVALNISDIWKQPVVVANRPGAGGRPRAVNRVPACGMRTSASRDARR